MKTLTGRDNRAIKKNTTLLFFKNLLTLLMILTVTSCQPASNKFLTTKESNGLQQADNVSQSLFITLIIIATVVSIVLVIIWLWSLSLKRQIHKQTQQIRESEEKFRILYNTSPDMYVSVSPEDATVLICNETLLQQLGYSREEVVGAPICNLYHEDCMEEVKKAFQQFTETGKIKDKELALKRKDGSKIDVSLNVNAVRDTAGKILHSMSSWRDITDRKKAEQTLRESVERFRLAFNQQFQFMAILSPEGHVLEISDLPLKAQGASREAYIGKLFWEIKTWENSPEWQDRVKKQVKQATVLQEPLLTEDVFFTADGKARTALASYTAIRDEKDNVRYLLVQALDITERKQAEEALRLSEERFRTQFESSPMPTFIWQYDNQQFMLIDYNTAVDKMTEGKAKHFLGLSTDQIYPDRPDLIDHFHACLNEKRSIVYETDYKARGTGRDGYIIFTFTHLSSDLIMLHTEDISERRQAQEALQKSEEKFRGIYEQSPLAIQVYDNEGKLIDLNQQTLELFGVEEKSHVLGFDMWADPNMTADKAEALKSGRAALISSTLDFEAVKTFNLFPTTRSGIIYLDLYAYPLIQKEEITGYLVQITDITERVKREEEKQQIEAQLRQQQKLESIGTLAGGVAHEINNPITGIMNYAQLIHERLNPEQERLREFAAGIGHETERVAQIVRNLLSFARQEKQSHSPANISDIMEGTLSLIRTIIRRDQITLEVDVPDDLPQLKCHSQQIQQVLMNLLTNARDALNGRYSEYDPNKIMSVTVHLFEKDGRRWLRTTVEDRGTGIPDEIKERLFDPFYTTKDRATGTGLGLSISLGIVQDHHGELTFESEEGKPTRFYLDLPVDNGWEL